MLTGIVLIACFPLGMHEPSGGRRSSVWTASFAGGQQRDRPWLFLQRRREGSQLCVCHRELSEAGCLELCWTNRIPYRQTSPSPSNIGTSAFRQQRRRHRQALFRSDSHPRRRSTARLKRNRKRDAWH